jgi:exopolysaccharide production protein ExoZ
VLYPLPDRVHLATGFTRVIYSCSAMALTLGFYRLKIPLVSGPLKGLSFLGKVSYSVYLLHPIVFFLGAYLVNRRLYPLSYILVSMIATFFVSWIVYEQFEKRFIGLGKKWS